MEMTKKRIDLMRLNIELGIEMKQFQKDSLTMQITEEAIARVNKCIVANEQINEETITALFNFLNELEKTHKIHVNNTIFKKVIIN